MTQTATTWRARFRLPGGYYTFREVTRKGRPLTRDEALQWAGRQVAQNDELLAVDDVYPVKGNDHD